MNSLVSDSPVCNLHLQNSSVFDSSVSAEENTQQWSILSVAWHKGKMGAAYFDTTTRELQAFAEVEENSSKCPVLGSLFQQLQPSVVMVKENLEEDRMNVVCDMFGIDKKQIEKETNLPRGHGYQFRSSICSTASASFTEEECSLIVVPSSYFDGRKAMNSLLGLHLITQPDDCSAVERSLYLKSSFPTTCQATLQASGALLLLLETKALGSDIGRMIQKTWDPDSFIVSALRLSYIKDLVSIDSISLSGLRVFSQEAHPSSNVKGETSSAKEGLSLFGLACKCYSSVGVAQLRCMFLKPTQNIETLKQRYSTIEFLRQPPNQPIVDKLASCLKRIVNLKTVLNNISLMQGSVEDWKKLLASTDSLLTLSHVCGTLPQSIRIFKKLKEIRCSGELGEIVSVIHRLFNFPESARLGRFVINDGVDANLDKLKATNEIRVKLFEEIANWEIARLPPFVNKAVIEFLPSAGHCLCVQSWLGSDEEMSAETLKMPGLEMKFFTKENVYYKSNWCYALDERFGDLGAEIVKHEMSIVFAAAKNISKFHHLLANGIELAGYLDALMSLASFSQEFHLVKPEPIESDTSFLHIVNGRHLMLELVVDQFVTSSATIGGYDHSANRVFMVTGPNASGKSFFLRQTAMILYLAQIGSFVPAESVYFTPVDQIHVVCSSTEVGAGTVSRCGFVFSRVARAVKEATPRSLVILDDLTEATLPADAEALIFAIVEQWVQTRFCPLVLMTAHFHQETVNHLKSAFRNRIKFLSMAHSLEDHQLIYSYKPVEDEEDDGDSFPLSVAKAVGISGCTLVRAKAVLSLIKENEITSTYNLLNNRQRSSALKALAKDLFAAGSSKNFRVDIKEALASFSEADPGGHKGAPSQYSACGDSVRCSASILSHD